MGQSPAREPIILLFDAYHADSRRLHDSFRLAGCDYPAVVIEETGFLPDTVQSVYGYFLGDYRQAPDAMDRPRYFNEIDIPDFWEISSTNLSGKVCDMNHERARLFYESSSGKRWVRTVDWLDEQGTVRYSDHYNRYGLIYARTTMDKNGKPVLKSYFAPDGREVIVENYVTRDILLNEGETTRVFPSKADFVLYFLQCAGYAGSRLFFNSLSTPFFVSCRLGGEKKDVLFWQEPIADAIPGNMQMILDGRAPRVGRIYVQKHTVYNRLLELGADPAMVQEKGYLYHFRRANTHTGNALICTNSDQIEQCEALVNALPQVQFHIAAVTEMSSKLTAMERYPNVHLYPGVKKSVLDALFENCDIYLDINRGNEIVSATYRAFLHNQVVFAFADICHNRDVVAQAHLFAADHVHGMIEALRRVLTEPDGFDKALQAQKKAALLETAEAFLSI